MALVPGHVQHDELGRPFAASHVGYRVLVDWPESRFKRSEFFFDASDAAADC